MTWGWLGSEGAGNTEPETACGGRLPVALAAAGVGKDGFAQAAAFLRSAAQPRGALRRVARFPCERAGTPMVAVLPFSLFLLASLAKGWLLDRSFQRINYGQCRCFPVLCCSPRNLLGASSSDDHSQSVPSLQWVWTAACRLL